MFTFERLYIIVPAEPTGLSSLTYNDSKERPQGVIYNGTLRKVFPIIKRFGNPKRHQPKTIIRTIRHKPWPREFPAQKTFRKRPC